MRHVAVLDACVLYSIAICDALLSLAAEDLFTAKWTSRIEAEWMRNLQANRPDLAGKLGRRRDAMRRAVPDWEIPEPSWLPLERTLAMPDPTDAHVLAAAIAGHADCIVTTNLKDFPRTALAAWSIEAIHPDDFIAEQIDVQPLSSLAAFKAMRSRRQRPQESADDFASALQRHGLALTAAKLREAATSI